MYKTECYISQSDNCVKRRVGSKSDYAAGRDLKRIDKPDLITKYTLIERGLSAFYERKVKVSQSTDRR